MIWSLVKILLFVAAIVGLTFGLSNLMETGGGVRISLAAYEFTLSPLQTVLALVAFLFVAWLILKLVGFSISVFKFLNGDETAISRYFARNREKRGFEALSEAMMALASGEARTAMAKATKAERYLNRPDLTNLITAQAAEISGDTKKAETVYKALLTDDKTRFVGVRGIMKQRLASGDTETALALAEKAFALKPKHEETQDILLKLQAGSEDWKGARNTLSAKLKSGSLPRDVHRRRDAVLALAEAKDVFDAGNSIEAKEAAIEANRLSPDLIPAAIMAARAYIEDNKERYATRVLSKVWSVQQHPEIAAAFAEIRPDESAHERIKRFRTLLKTDPSNPESKMLLAELNIAAEDYPAARRALGDLPELQPTARSLAIMAAIERGEGADDAVVRGWLAKTLTAPRGPKWVCDNCNHIHANWVGVCENCQSLDTLSWKEPPQSEVEDPSGAAMLPLLIDPPQLEEADVVEEAQIEDIEVAVDGEVSADDEVETARRDG